MNAPPSTASTGCVASASRNLRRPCALQPDSTTRPVANTVEAVLGVGRERAAELRELVDDVLAGLVGLVLEHGVRPRRVGPDVVAAYCDNVGMNDDIATLRRAIAALAPKPQLRRYNADLGAKIVRPRRVGPDVVAAYCDNVGMNDDIATLRRATRPQASAAALQRRAASEDRRAHGGTS